jgi:hypothetical protein
MPGGSDRADDLDDVLTRLRTTPLDGFLDARKALAAELKAAGRKDDAKVVAAVRKPTASAWAVDQLHHLRADELGELLALGEELRSGQRRALSTGQGGAALRETAARRRTLVRTLTDAAAGALATGGRAVSPSTRDEISGTLDAATVDPEVAAALAEGSLDKATVAPAGFGPLDHLTLVPPDRAAPERRPERPRAAPAAPAEATEPDEVDAEPGGADVVELPVAAAPKGPTAAERARVESAEASVAAAEGGLRQAQDDADAAVVAAQDARRAAQDAATEADRLEAQARAARRAAISADAAATRAAKAVDRAREGVDKAERKLDTAQARLDALLDDA